METQIATLGCILCGPTFVANFLSNEQDDSTQGDDGFKKISLNSLYCFMGHEYAYKHSDNALLE